MDGRSSGVAYKTAAGEILADEGQATFKCRTEGERPVVVKGRQMSVHKTLISASRACDAGLDFWVDRDGGVLLPSGGPVAKGLHREYARLIKIHTSKNIMDVYKENGVYNLYVQKTAEKDSGGDAKTISGLAAGTKAWPSTSLGGPRQA